MKNGVGRQHAGFTPWFWSYRLAAKIEAVVVVCVIAGVIAILALLFRMPGPLVVHLQDEKKDPIMGARVRCTSPDGQTSHAGSTDVFGEAKGTEDILTEIRGLREGGAFGSIVGRNAFQRPREEAIQLLRQIMDIYQGK